MQNNNDLYVATGMQTSARSTIQFSTDASNWTAATTGGFILSKPWNGNGRYNYNIYYELEWVFD